MTKLSAEVFAEGLQTFSQNAVSIAIEAEGGVSPGYSGTRISVGADLRITRLFKAMWLALRPYSAQVVSQTIGESARGRAGRVLEEEVLYWGGQDAHRQCPLEVELPSPDGRVAALPGQHVECVSVWFYHCFLHRVFASLTRVSGITCPSEAYAPLFLGIPPPSPQSKVEPSSTSKPSQRQGSLVPSLPRTRPQLEDRVLPLGRPLALT